jgi:hypothetical protein
MAYDSMMEKQFVGGGSLGAMACAPKQPQKFELIARQMDQNNGRLVELIGRLKRVRNTVLGAAPESPDKAGAVPTPDGAVNYISNATQNAEILLDELAAVIGGLETL